MSTTLQLYYQSSQRVTADLAANQQADQADQPVAIIKAQRYSTAATARTGVFSGEKPSIFRLYAVRNYRFQAGRDLTSAIRRSKPEDRRLLTTTSCLLVTLICLLRIVFAY